MAQSNKTIDNGTHIMLYLNNNLKSSVRCLSTLRDDMY